MHPPLLELSAGAAASTILVEPGDRDDASVRASFVREVAGLDRNLVQGRPVTIAWPAGQMVDAEIEKHCVLDALGQLEPETVAYTFGGDDREPAWPQPITASRDADGWRIGVDTDRGRPAELVRAAERRLPEILKEISDGAVTIEFQGDGVVSRTLRAALVDAVTAMGPDRLTVSAQGQTDVLVPALLDAASLDDGAVRVAADPAGRSPEQLESDLEREFGELEIEPGATVVVGAGEIAETLRSRLVGHDSVARVELETDRGRVQVHPAFFTAVARSEAGARLDVADVDALAADEDAIRARIDHELPESFSPGDLAGTTVTVGWPGVRRPYEGALAALVEKLVALQPEAVCVDPGDGKPARQAWPEVPRTFVEIIGRKDDAEPPMAMLRVDATGGEADRDAVVGALQGLDASVVDGRRLLVVFAVDEQERATQVDDPVDSAVIEALKPRAAALLVLRGGRPRAKFEVVHSTLEAFAVGKEFFDPRTR